MLTFGQVLLLDIEKPAAGGRMIARAAGQVVLVSGAIPGERATVRIERVTKAVAYGQAVSIDRPSVDRRAQSGDPLCGGCVYAGIAYPRQLQLKAQVIADALGRIGRIPWSSSIPVAASPEGGYRMRARLHLRDGAVGFFREASHDLCDARATRQLLPASSDALDQIAATLRATGFAGPAEVELSENVDASERVVHLEGTPGLTPDILDALTGAAGLTGLTRGSPLSSGTAHALVLSGDPWVRDVLTIGGVPVALKRHVLSFFQGNRFLLHTLAAHVVEAIAPGQTVVDLYAGAGLFAMAAALTRGATVTAVEGDEASAADLVSNAASAHGLVDAVHQSVETFLAQRRSSPGTLIVDPPRTGMSRAALGGAIALAAGQVVYVSCDVATLARDARRLLDAGYQLVRLDAFDLFPNTPHIETVACFRRAS